MEQTIEEQKDDAGENMGNDNFKENGKHDKFWCNKTDKKTGKKKWACADCQAGLVYDVKPEFNAYSMKDRRISFLSIFSSLTQNSQMDFNTLEKWAYKINDGLYVKYPTEEK